MIVHVRFIGILALRLTRLETVACSRFSAGLDPPSCRVLRKYGIFDRRSNPRCHSLGCIEDSRLACQVGLDIDRSFCTFGTFFKNIRVAFGIEIKTIDIFRKAIVINHRSTKTPMHGMNFHFAVRNDQTLTSSKVSHDRH